LQLVVAIVVPPVPFLRDSIVVVLLLGVAELFRALRSQSSRGSARGRSNSLRGRRRLISVSISIAFEAIDDDAARGLLRRQEALVDRRLELVLEARGPLDGVLGELGQLGDAAEQAGLEVSKVARKHFLVFLF
jgi:hypothetical protein